MTGGMPHAADSRYGDIVLPLLIGVAAGLASGLFGIGGGLVIVPALVLFAGVSQHQAHANSLGAVIPIASAAAVPYLLSGNVFFLLSLSMALTAVIGARYGARLMHALSEAQLKVLFGLLMLLVAIRMFFGIEAQPGAEAQDPALIIAWGLAIGAAAGLGSSLLGIGGGLIMVPAMALALGIPQHLATGTSLVAIVPTALSGTFANRQSGFVNPRLIAALGTGGVAAGVGGSLLALHLSALVLQRGLALLLVVALVRMIVPVIRGRWFRSPAPEEP